jgi:hypothetical protein
MIWKEMIEIAWMVSLLLGISFLSIVLGGGSILLLEAAR